MIRYKQISVHGNLVEAALRPCPWCKKTPNLSMRLDQRDTKEEQTWVWKIECRYIECRVKPEVSVSIRNTSKTNLSRFLDKLDEWYDRWNHGNDCKAYEKKVIDLKMIPNLGIR